MTEQNQSTLGTDDPAMTEQTDEQTDKQTAESTLLDELPPDKLLETDQLRLITAGLRIEDKPAVLQKYLEYERSHQDREGVKRRIRQAIERAGGEPGPEPGSVVPTDSATSSVLAQNHHQNQSNGATAPNDVLDNDGLNAIRSHLKQVTDRDTLEALRAYEENHRTRQKVLQAIELRAEALD